MILNNIKSEESLQEFINELSNIRKIFKIFTKYLRNATWFEAVAFKSLPSTNAKRFIQSINVEEQLDNFVKFINLKEIQEYLINRIDPKFGLIIFDEVIEDLFNTVSNSKENFLSIMTLEVEVEIRLTKSINIPII